MEIYNITLAFMLLVLFLLLKYNWERRWLYYYASKLPGPMSLPVLGSVSLIAAARKDFYKKILQICESYPPVFRLWIGSDFYVVNSEPEQVEFLLTTFMDKSPFYQIWDDFLNKTILTAPASKWKGRRKMMNLSFNPQVLNSFHEIFNKYAKNIVKMLDDVCGKELTNLVPEIWKQSIDTGIETIVDFDPNLIEDRYDNIPVAQRGAEIIIQRFQQFWLLIDVFWRFSKSRKEVMLIQAHIDTFGERALKLRLERMDGLSEDDCLRKKRFVHLMYDLFQNDSKISWKEFRDEVAMLMVAASETTSITITSVILVLGLYPELQDKIYQEICSIIGTNQEDFSLEDINRMAYLECVIKETLRLLPTAPIIMRSISKDTQLGSYTFPAGSNVMIPIMNIHRRPDLWPDPLKFDPSRFSPENVAKRHRCAYIPFSFGTRNCVGLKYGMMSMKTSLAHIVKNFTIKALNYQSLEDLDIKYTFLAQPIGYRIKLEKRKKY